jgi:hypothetical protein
MMAPTLECHSRWRGYRNPEADADLIGFTGTDLQPGIIELKIIDV